MCDECKFVLQFRKLCGPGNILQRERVCVEGVDTFCAGAHLLSLYWTDHYKRYVYLCCSVPVLRLA